MLQQLLSPFKIGKVITLTFLLSEWPIEVLMKSLKVTVHLLQVEVLGFHDLFPVLHWIHQALVLSQRIHKSL